MNDREKWRERVRDIRASSTTWWWGYIYLRWPYTSLAKAERRGSDPLKIRISPWCAQFSHFRPSLTLPVRTFRVIKGKEKKQIVFLYISIVVFLCYTAYVFFNQAFSIPHFYLFYNWSVQVFVSCHLYLSFQMLFSQNMALAGAESTWEKYGTFLNSFHPDVKWLKQRL